MIQWPILNYSRGLGEGGCPPPPDWKDLILFAPLLNSWIRYCCSIQHSWYGERHCRALTNTSELHATSFPLKQRSIANLSWHHHNKATLKPDHSNQNDELTFFYRFKKQPNANRRFRERSSKASNRQWSRVPTIPNFVWIFVYATSLVQEQLSCTRYLARKIWVSFEMCYCIT